MGSQRQWDSSGVAYAVLSGAVASGVGYAIWYSALPFLRPTQAATVQLSVPVLTAMGGVCLLGEALTLRLVLCSAAVLGGIALTLGTRRVAPTQAPVPTASPDLSGFQITSVNDAALLDGPASLSNGSSPGTAADSQEREHRYVGLDRR